MKEGTNHPKRLDDYVEMGRYVVLVCIAAELMILPHVTSQFYMMFAGAAPRVIGCEGQPFDAALEDKEMCQLYSSLGDNCTEPMVDYQFYSINVEWGYLCGAAKIVKNSISVQMFGVLIGSVVFGQLSDSFGRKNSMLLSMFGMMSGWLMVSFSGDLTQFTVTRTVTGFFTGGSISVFNVFILENVPKHLRMWISMAITWSPNMPIMAIIAWMFPHWHSYALANAALCLPPILFCIFLIHESPRWLVSRGRVSEAREIIRRQLKTSGKLALMDDEFEDVLMSEYQRAVQANAKNRQYSYYHLYSTWRLATISSVIAFSYFATSIVNYGIIFNMEKLSGSIFLNCIYTGLMRYACNIFFGFLDLKFKCIGRKFIHTSGVVLIILSLSLVVFAYYFELTHSLREEIRLSILLASSMTSQIYIADGIVGNELFPTPIRNIGYSWLQMWNRFGVVVSPFVFHLTEVWVALPYCVMILFSSIDAVAFECCLPETKGKPMIDHMPAKEERIFGRRRNRSPLVETLVDQSKLEEAKA